MIAQWKRRVTSQCFAGIILILAGCESDAPIDVADYTARLSRVLEQPVEDRPRQAAPRLPRKRDLTLEFAEQGIDLLEFLAIGDCRLQALVAERNSSLGRLARASQRLVYEIRFLQAAAKCADTIEDKQTAATIRSVTAVKRGELPGRIWMATLGGEEFRRFWVVDGAAPVTDPQLLHALESLNADVARWLAGDLQVDAFELEASLEQVRRGGGGSLLNAWWYLQADLQVATRLLNERYQGRPLCFDGMKTEQARIFQRVTTRFFIGGIQQEVAAVNRDTFRIMQQIRALEDKLESAEPRAYALWRVERARIIEQGRQAMVDHVNALEPLLRQCGFLPG